jgi:toxin CcdB
MAQFDVHKLPSPRVPGRLLLDVQSDHLDLLASRLVIPLVPERLYGEPMARLNPAFSIGGSRYVLVTQEATSVPKTMLAPPFASLKAQRDAILGALDLLIIGY